MHVDGYSYLQNRQGKSRSGSRLLCFTVTFHFHITEARLCARSDCLDISNLGVKALISCDAILFFFLRRYCPGLSDVRRL